MKLVDIILLFIILIIVSLAVAYIIKEKKKGTKCIGCPVAGNCSSRKNSEGLGCGCGCSSRADTKK